VIAPRGLPPAISKKLGDAIRKVTLEPSFQKVLTSFDIPYDFLDQEGLEKKVRNQYEWFKVYLAKAGIKTTK
jgi:tripartite-type tricarboxylate transporter receptor subunit TctC